MSLNRNWIILKFSWSRNWHIGSLSGPRRWHNVSVLGPETDIMGKIYCIQMQGSTDTPCGPVDIQNIKAMHSIERKHMNVVSQTKNNIMLFSASGNKFYCALSSLYGLIGDISWPFCIKMVQMNLKCVFLILVNFTLYCWNRFTMSINLFLNCPLIEILWQSISFWIF